MEFPEDRLYSKEGFWLKLEGDTATIGISESLIAQIGHVTKLQFNESSEDTLLVIHNGRNFASFLQPIAGSPIPDGYNMETLEEPSVINDDPYGENSWLYKMTFEKSSATELMTAGKFRDFIGE